jgi:penicillin-binding protein 2
LERIIAAEAAGDDALKRGWILAGIVIAVSAAGLAACSSLIGENNGYAFPTSTGVPPVVAVTEVPSPEAAARAFLSAWQVFDYENMYALLSSLSRDAQTKEQFQDYYQKVKETATLRSIDYAITSVQMSPTDAEVTYDITLRTVLVGDIQKSTRMLLKFQDGGWKVSWDEATILPELKGGNTLIMNHEVPARGNIYDRNGLALASMAEEMLAVGVIPGDIVSEDTVVTVLFQVLHIPREEIRGMFTYENPDWYYPIGDINKDDVGGMYGMLISTPGIALRPAADTRYYYGGGVASHVVGYIAPQQPGEQQAYYKALGYTGGEMVGQVGLEAWGEQYLAGRQGGTLAVYSPAGARVATLAQSDPVPGMSITTTLDRKLQEQMEQTLMAVPYTGAAVVLKRDTGEVLGMMSSPTYDSNLFNPDNPDNRYIGTLIFERNDTPLLNRATSGQYPLGSVFKIITMSAGLESGRFTPDSPYECNGYFLEIPNFPMTDWTIEHDTKPHGKEVLSDCLTRSCNPCFWHVGLDLYYNDSVWRVPDMARSYGLGRKTGIGVIQEDPGFVPDAAWKKESTGEDWTEMDALQQAIGQGELLVNPLQVADFVAAVGNGGTLYRPQLILSIKPPLGDAVFTFQPEVRGTLPVQPDNLAAIQKAMTGVVNDPKGTARHRFYEISSAIKIAGKTGTASNNTLNPHSWFVSYTFSENPNKPDIATAVVVEYAGEGSTYAAPMTRRILEIYYYGSPKALYPWESTYGTRGTSTPEETAEPTTTISP